MQPSTSKKTKIYFKTAGCHLTKFPHPQMAIPPWKTSFSKSFRIGESSSAENNGARGNIQASRPHRISSITHPASVIPQIRRSRRSPFRGVVGQERPAPADAAHLTPEAGQSGTEATTLSQAPLQDMLMPLSAPSLTIS